jgi:hypothetical protein
MLPTTLQEFRELMESVYAIATDRCDPDTETMLALDALTHVTGEQIQAIAAAPRREEE